MNVIFTLILLAIAGALIFRSLSNTQQEAVKKNTKRVQKSVKKNLDVNKDGKLNLEDAKVAVKATEEVVKKVVKRGRKPKITANTDVNKQ
jgi:biopolymer transport protein ExbD